MKARKELESLQPLRRQHCASCSMSALTIFFQQTKRANRFIRLTPHWEVNVLYQTSLVAIIIMTISGIGLSVLGWIAYAKARAKELFEFSVWVYVALSIFQTALLCAGAGWFLSFCR